MLDFIKYISVAFTALSLAFTGWLQYEKFRLDGEWQIDTCTEQADFTRYEGLHLAWRVFLSDDPLSAPVVGDGEKTEFSVGQDSQVQEAVKILADSKKYQTMLESPKAK